MTAHGGEDTDTLRASEVEIVLGQGLVLVGGRAMPLSVREFNLLAALVRRPGAVATRDELYAEAWGSELRPGDRQVDVYVAKLRRNLRKAMPDRRFIHTEHGHGYRFQLEPLPENASRRRRAGSQGRFC